MKMGTPRRRTAGTAAGAALLATILLCGAGALEATPGPEVDPPAPGPDSLCPHEEAGPSRPAVADHLAKRAGEQARSEGAWRLAARLLRHSADLRPPCDPDRFRALRAAAGYYRLAGDLGLATDLSLAAADDALRIGHLAAAADALIEAATTALEAGDEERAREAADRAALLAESPLLGTAQRLAIRGRVSSILEGSES